MIGWIAKSIASGVLGSIFSPIADAARSYMEAKLQDKRIEIETASSIRLAETSARIKAAEAGQRWDETWSEQAAHSWKDEYWTVVLSLPLILIFIPVIQPYIIDGFNALMGVPEWYLMSVAIAISASFGFQKFVEVMSRWKK